MAGARECSGSSGARAGRWAVALALGALLASVWGGSAAAAGCGGKKECRCGDRVERDTRLGASLGPCPQDGLTLAAGVTLDGGGHTLRGAGLAGTAGIRLPAGSTGAVVRNLEITGFARGLRFIGVRGARAEGLDVHHNGDRRQHKGYGIDFGDGASGNTVARSRVHDNADEGIHVGTAANDNRLLAVEAWGNSRENLYFLQNSGNRVEGGRVGAAGEAAVYIKHARATVLSGVLIAGGIVHIRGNSVATVLEQVRITDGGIVLEPYRKGGTVSGTPADTRIEGGSIAGPSACLRIDGARGTLLRETRLTCDPAVRIGGGATLETRGLSRDAIRCNGAARVRGTAPSRLLFLDSEGKPLSGVKLLAPAGRVLAVSDAAGRIREALPAWEVECPGRTEEAVKLIARHGGWTREVAVGESTPVVVEPWPAGGR